ncbi:MAG: hypothetical protein WA102_03680 [Candidatus Methanoperedens sp.]
MADPIERIGYPIYFMTVYLETINLTALVSRDSVTVSLENTVENVWSEGKGVSWIQKLD